MKLGVPISTNFEIPGKALIPEAISTLYKSIVFKSVLPTNQFVEQVVVEFWTIVHGVKGKVRRQ